MIEGACLPGVLHDGVVRERIESIRHLHRSWEISTSVKIVSSVLQCHGRRSKKQRVMLSRFCNFVKLMLSEGSPEIAKTILVVGCELAPLDFQVLAAILLFKPS